LTADLELVYRWSAGRRKHGQERIFAYTAMASMPEARIGFSPPPDIQPI
jgi:hypothetical protein